MDVFVIITHRIHQTENKQADMIIWQTCRERHAFQSSYNCVIGLHCQWPAATEQCVCVCVVLFRATIHACTTLGNIWWVLTRGLETDTNGPRLALPGGYVDRIVTRMQHCTVSLTYECVKDVRIVRLW